MPVSPKYVLINWAALIALWAPTYLAVMDRLRLDAARSELLHWLLLAIGVIGMCSVLYISWQDARDRRGGSSPDPQRRTKLGTAGF